MTVQIFELPDKLELEIVDKTKSFLTSLLGTTIITTFMMMLSVALLKHITA